MPAAGGRAPQRGGAPAVWMSHWKLDRDPFHDRDGPFVPLPAHREAVARLVETIESERRLAVIREGAGVGKSRALAQALAEMRGPGRRIARVASPTDGSALFASLAEALGVRAARGAQGRSAAWRYLGEAVRLCRWQRLHVILAVDDCQDLVDRTDRLDLDRLAHADPLPDARLTVLKVFRVDDEPAPPDDSWDLAIRIPGLTRSECELYLEAKLAAAGRADPTFTPRALNRLHALSEGVPRGVDRLATLALMAGASRGLEVITPEVVEGASLECVRTA